MSNQELIPEGVGEDIVVVADKRNTSFNIDSFRSSIRKDGTLPKHSFLVSMSPFTGPNAAMLNKHINASSGDSLVMRCDSATLPAPVAFKDEVRRYGYGPVEEVVYGMQFGDFVLSFIVDSAGSQIRFFDDWMNVITNYESKGGSNMVVGSDKSGMKPYEVGYKDDYANRQMNVNVYDRQLNRVMIYELYDVFPTLINTPDVNWGDTDQLFRYTVRFAYTDFTVITPQIALPDSQITPAVSPPISGKVGAQSGGATGIGTFASSGREKTINISDISNRSNPTSILTSIGSSRIPTIPSDKILV